MSMLTSSACPLRDASSKRLPRSTRDDFSFSFILVTYNQCVSMEDMVRVVTHLKLAKPPHQSWVPILSIGRFSNRMATSFEDTTCIKNSYRGTFTCTLPAYIFVVLPSPWGGGGYSLLRAMASQGMTGFQDLCLK